jgi:hypothetical protein
MDSNLSTSRATDRPCATGPIAGVRSDCYVDPAPLMDVMLDQLRYLLSHQSPNCAPDCADCERLAGVEGWLLLPFRTHRSAAPLESSLLTRIASRAF